MRRGQRGQPEARKTGTTAKWDPFALVFFAAGIAIVLFQVVKSAKASYDPSNFAAFQDWMEEHDITSVGVTVKKLPDVGKGVVATQNMKAGQTILRVPFGSMMSEVAARACPIGKHFGNLELKGNDLLTAFLIYLKKYEVKEWAAYINMLPRSVDVPALWSDADLELLKGSSLVEYSKKKRADYEAGFKFTFSYFFHEHPKIFAPGSVTLEDYIWAATVVDSRSFRVVSGNYNMMALVPFGDMFNNHLKEHVQTVEKMDKGALNIILTEDVAAGDHIYAFYGSKQLSNEQLLYTYGFVHTNNTVYSVVVPTAMNENDNLWEVRKSLLLQHGLAKTSYPIVAIESPGHEIPPALMHVLRIAVLNNAEANDAKTDKDWTPKKFINTRNENAAWNLLEAKLKKLDEGYPGTRAEQEMRLSQLQTMTPHQRAAFLITRGERWIIANLMTNVELHHAIEKSD